MIIIPWKNSSREVKVFSMAFGLVLWSYRALVVLFFADAALNLQWWGPPGGGADPVVGTILCGGYPILFLGLSLSMLQLASGTMSLESRRSWHRIELVCCGPFLAMCYVPRKLRI